MIVKDIQDLLSNVACAERRGLTPVTTEKDMARLRGNPAAAELTARSAVLPVHLRLSDAAGLEAMLRGAIREGAA